MWSTGSTGYQSVILIMPYDIYWFDRVPVYKSNCAMCDLLVRPGASLSLIRPYVIYWFDRVPVYEFNYAILDLLVRPGTSLSLITPYEISWFDCVFWRPTCVGCTYCVVSCCEDLTVHPLGTPISTPPIRIHVSSPPDICGRGCNPTNQRQTIVWSERYFAVIWNYITFPDTCWTLTLKLITCSKFEKKK
jgi:hypothetical protein